MLKAIWYHLVLGILVIVPALICQSVFPVISHKTWESLSEPIYSTLLRFDKPNQKRYSQVKIVEVDQASIDSFGWPIPTRYYVSFLDKLKKSGQPWVLSLLNFQKRDSDKLTPAERTARKQEDDSLKAAIAGYERYVGSGLKINDKEELTIDQEKLLIQKNMVSKRELTVNEELPRFPLAIDEHYQFVEAEKAFGFGARFEPKRIVYCQPAYLEDAARSGQYVIPSALIWVSAYTKQTGFKTQSGAGWPPSGKVTSAAMKKKALVGEKQCFSSPELTTHQFLQTRRIETISFESFLQSEKTWKWANRLVVLARSDMRLYRGPGHVTNDDDGVVPEQLLVARFLDDLLSGKTVWRVRLEEQSLLSWLPLVLSVFLILFSFFSGLAGMILMVIIAFLCLMVLAMINLAYYQEYFIPIQAIASSLLSLAGLFGLFLFIKYYGIRRKFRFSEKLRSGLSQCNTLDEIKMVANTACEKEFIVWQCLYSDYDAKLYQAIKDPKKVLELLSQRKSVSAQEARSSSPATMTPAMVTGMNLSPIAGFFNVVPHQVKVKMAIEARGGRLGIVDIALTYHQYEEGFIPDLIDILRMELGLHWYRVDLLLKGKLQDYQIFLQETRSNILAKFLSKVIVTRFADNATMEENLRNILMPRKARVALLQADIRGYSKLSENRDPLDVVKLLQSYYRHVVDVAQLVAQVKLIGDAIFLFIEEPEKASFKEEEPMSAVDHALRLASILVETTVRQNEKIRVAAKDGQPFEVAFGIAIHFGDVIVGNLSSENCIDYTVIGANVNLVARMEESTKAEGIKNLVGPNAVLMSLDAMDALRKYRSVNPEVVDLKEINVQIRSFSNVSKVAYIKSDKAIAVGRGGV